MKTQRWQRAIAIGLGMSGAIGLSFTPAIAQLKPIEDTAPDRSLDTTVEPFNAQIDLIKNGARSANGVNLFHSFREFNIDQNRGAYFIVPDANVLNILARVTGGNSSQILGVLGTRQQLADGTFLTTNTNLFLMNPSGIIFGQGAQLDVGGSFVATTANAIQFGDQGSFSATNPAVPSAVLTINPSAFLFEAISAQKSPEIVVLSNAANPLGGNGLQVPDGQSLLLVGGDIRLEGGTLQATTNGRIELGGLSDRDKIDLSTSNGLFRLGFPDTAARANVSITNGSKIQVITLVGGDVAIHAQNVEISRGSNLVIGIGSITGTVGNRAGDINIDARGAVTLSDASFLFNAVFLGSPNGGNIKILGQTVNVLGGSIVATPSFADGDAGSVNIQANDTIAWLCCMIEKETEDVPERLLN